jgi:hypothetical protein
MKAAACPRKVATVAKWADVLTLEMCIVHMTFDFQISGSEDYPNSAGHAEPAAAPHIATPVFDTAQLEKLRASFTGLISTA